MAITSGLAEEQKTVVSLTSYRNELEQNREYQGRPCHMLTNCLSHSAGNSG